MISYYTVHCKGLARLGMDSPVERKIKERKKGGEKGKKTTYENLNLNLYE